MWAAVLRLVLAALLLGGWTVARRQAWPRGPALRAALAYGVCQFGINFPLLYWGEQRVPSGVAAVFYATLPLTNAFLTRALGLERLTARKLIGGVVAFGGVLLLFSSSLHGAATPVALLAVFAGTLATALGTVLLKRGPRQDPVAANAVGCAIGGAVAIVASLALGEPWSLPTTAAAAVPLLYLTVAGSLGAFVIMSWLIQHWPVTRSSFVSVIVPIIALGLGTLVRHERLTAAGVGGSAIVLVGLLIGMRGAPASGAAAVRTAAAQVPAPSPAGSPAPAPASTSTTRGG